MRTPDPTEEERRVLKNHKRKAPEILVQAKSEAILLAAEDVDIAVIARFTDREPSTVEQWLRDWEKTRLASVVTGHTGNLNASKLTSEQRAEVAAHLSRPPCDDDALPAAFWDVPKLAGWLSTRFGILYESPSSYHFLLKFAGLTFHKPEAFDKRRDDALVEARMAEIRTEVSPLVENPAWEVFAADEVRLGQEADIRRAWLPCGSKAVVKVERRRDAQSYIGFLNQRDGSCELERLEWQNAEQVLAALIRLLARHQGKRICLVWDNAAWHKNRLIRAQLAKGGILEKVHLIAMPPYAPDHNPIEHVWKAAKDHAANLQREDFDDTAHRFEEFTASRTFNYKL
jgi:transposase